MRSGVFVYFALDFFAYRCINFLNLKYKIGAIKMENVQINQIPHHKVFVFGSRDLSNIPQSIVNHIAQILEITKGDVEFIVSDAPGLATSFQKTIAMLGGMSKTTVYVLDNTKSNVYDMMEKKYTSVYKEDTKQVDIVNPDGVVVSTIDGVNKPDDIYANPSYYDVRDREMCNDCTFAICYWDGTSRGTLRNVDRLKAQNKEVYIYTAQIH